MKKRTRLLGACGLYCGACYHHRASLPEGQRLLEAAARQGRALDARSGRVPTRGASNIAACVTSSLAIGYGHSRATAAFTTATYWAIWKNC
jgi:hypothetical protein